MTGPWGLAFVALAGAVGGLLAFLISDWVVVVIIMVPFGVALGIIGAQLDRRER